jgi:hypothetical protein
MEACTPPSPFLMLLPLLFNGTDTFMTTKQRSRPADFLSDELNDGAADEMN